MFRLSTAILCFALLLTASASFGATASKKGGEISPENPANPWDYVGRAHNEALDRIAAALTPHRPDPRPERVAIYVFKETVETTQAYLGGFDFGVLPYEALADVAASQDVAYPALDAEQLSYLEAVVSTATKVGLTPQERIAAMIQLEAEIEDSLDADRALPILASASVGRHSLAYWSSQDADLTPWDLYPSSSPFGSALRNVDPTVEADIRGGALGAVGGPEGVVAGAVITSAFNLAGRIWDYFF